MKLEITPNGWPVPFLDCPPGFFVYKERLCFKPSDGNIIAFWDNGNEWKPTGEDVGKPYRKIFVQPVWFHWTGKTDWEDIYVSE